VNVQKSSTKENDKPYIELGLQLIATDPTLTAGAAQRLLPIEDPEQARRVRRALDYQIRKTITHNIPAGAEELVLEPACMGLFHCDAPGCDHSGGYQLCGTCGDQINAGDKAYKFNDTYMHPWCAERCPAPEWKKALRAELALKSLTKQTPWAPEDASPAFIKMLGPDYQETLGDWSQERYDTEMSDVSGNQDYPNEAQLDLNTEDDSEGEQQVTPYSGQRWNGKTLADNKDFLKKQAVRCDIPRVARLMDEIGELQVLQEERASLYVTWGKEKLEADRNAVKHPFISSEDQRNPDIGLNFRRGRIVDGPEPEAPEE